MKAFFVFSLLLAPPSLAATGVTCQTEAADGSTLQMEILGSTDLTEGSILLVRALGVGVVEVETIVEAVRRKPEAQAVDLRSVKEYGGRPILATLTLENEPFFGHPLTGSGELRLHQHPPRLGLGPVRPVYPLRDCRGSIQ